MFNLVAFKNQVGEWNAKNFKGQKSYQMILGLTEEVGELAHAHLKGEQGICHNPEEIKRMKIDAIGDIVIFLAQYCNLECISLDEAIETTWAKVVERKWAKDGSNG